jgi:hypothetical protein
MVAELVRIGEKNLPPAIAQEFRVNGITEESLSIKTDFERPSTPEDGILKTFLEVTHFLLTTVKVQVRNGQNLCIIYLQVRLS